MLAWNASVGYSFDRSRTQEACNVSCQYISDDRECLRECRRQEMCEILLREPPPAVWYDRKGPQLKQNTLKSYIDGMSRRQASD